MPDQDKLDETKRKLQEFLDSIGDPPHLIALVVGDEALSEDERYCAAAVSVSQKMLMPHYETMIGAMLAALSDHDHTKAQHLIQAAATSTRRTIDEHHELMHKARRGINLN